MRKRIITTLYGGVREVCIRVVPMILYNYVDSGAVCFQCGMAMCGAGELVCLTIYNLLRVMIQMEKYIIYTV